MSSPSLSPALSPSPVPYFTYPVATEWAGRLLYFSVPPFLCLVTLFLFLFLLRSLHFHYFTPSPPPSSPPSQLSKHKKLQKEYGDPLVIFILLVPLVLLCTFLLTHLLHMTTVPLNGYPTTNVFWEWNNWQRLRHAGESHVYTGDLSEEERRKVMDNGYNWFEFFQNLQWRERTPKFGEE